MAISKITTNGFNFANGLSRGDFTDSSFGDIVLLENEVGGLLMDSSASGVDVDGHILYNNNESAFFFRDISSTQLSDGAVTLSKISSDTKDQLNEDHIALENEDGNLLLNSSAASTDEGDRIVFNEVFNPSTFNIGGTLTAGNAIKIDSSGLGFEFGSAGKVLQVVSVTKTDTFTSTSTSHVDITNLSLSITPSSTSSKIQIIAMLSCGATNTASCHFLIDRGGSPIIRGDEAGSRPRSTTSVQSNASGQPMSATINTIDSPATTSSTTYKIQMRNSGGGTSAIKFKSSCGRS